MVLAARQGRSLLLNDWVAPSASEVRWEEFSNSVRVDTRNLGRVGLRHVPSLLRQTETAVDPQARQSAIEGLRTWVGDRRVRAWMQRSAVADLAPRVRRAAVESLIVRWGQDPEVERWLQERALNDPSPGVQRAAMAGVGRASGNPGVRAWLQERAVADPDPLMRGAVILALGYSRDPELVAWLQERAVGDPDPYVRWNAIDVVAGWAAHPDLEGQRAPLMEWLQQRALDDQAPEAQTAAVRGIAALGITDAHTQRWLLDRVTATDRAAVGVEVMNAAARRLPDAQAVLRQWAEDQELSPLARRQALEYGGLMGGVTPGSVQSWLERRAQEDPDPAVRAAAAGQRRVRRTWVSTWFERLQG